MMGCEVSKSGSLFLSALPLLYSGLPLSETKTHVKGKGGVATKQSLYQEAMLQVWRKIAANYVTKDNNH